MKTVAALIFKGMAPLDLFGPIQVFNVACTPREDDSTKPDTAKPLYKVITVGKESGLVATGANGAGPVVVAEHGIKDDFDFDILLVPGGGGTRTLVADPEFINALSAACERADVVASVCTGAALLAQTKILDNKAATSNKTAWNWVLTQGESVDWDPTPRWVDLVDKNTGKGIITSAGVSAGIDMTLALVADLDGEQVAENAAVFIEHHR
ncbi:MAG TPA: DJ-1/PfpI family protein, partial [Dehalococcoidia bacterium]|nr:DJ-1/PfpI family protein [Dehalococcoidia bacterium]